MINFGVQRRYQISEPTEIAPVRRAASALAEVCGFSASRVGEVALVVTEAATNILKFAGKNKIVFQYLGYKTQKIEIPTDKLASSLDVKMIEESYSLNEVVINTKDNPANAIISLSLKLSPIAIVSSCLIL